MEDFNSRLYNSYDAQINPEDKLVNLSRSDSDNSEYDAKYMQDPHYVEQKH